ncbi:MAG: peptidoglycan bridge formation glycyltransferase FemA/FemB family protein [Candidatus Pacebacteria bacterium]|nr:peptidoglycan bridge formation glycyltransferase FemA/FemB family protein [Candidatus Paceibacterota bacterium]
MEFLKVEKDKREEWDGFIRKNKPECFLQSFGWGDFQRSVGNSVLRYAVSDGNQFVAVASVLERKSHGLKYWYIPRGPVTMEEEACKSEENFGESKLCAASRDEEIGLMTFILVEIKKEARKKGVIFLRMDPAWDKKFSFIFSEMGLMSVGGIVQPKDTLILDIRKNEDELLCEMKQKTRYNVRLAEKKGVKILAQDFSEKNFEDFWGLTMETAKRDGITTHDREYYHEMLRMLGSGSEGLEAKLYSARYEGKTIAANIVLRFGDCAIYLHGASSDKSRNLMAPYLLQWNQIKDMKNAGCKSYDFWGITIDDENPKWRGITRFKKGFGGKEVSYVGVYDLPVNKILYSIYSRTKK